MMLEWACGLYFGDMPYILKRYAVPLYIKDPEVMLLDALGLGVFAVAGCEKARAFGLTWPGAVLLGVITAAGGSVVRDIMAAEVPRALREDVYALAAFAGAAAYALGVSAGVPETAVATGAVVLAFAIRVASVRFGWRLPRAPWS